MYLPLNSVSKQVLTLITDLNIKFIGLYTAYIAEAKRSLGLSMYDAPNAAEELKQPRKHSPKEKAEAIMEALKYFEVI